MNIPPLLASTGPLFGRGLDWGMGVIAEAGYDGVELMVTRDPDTQDASTIQRMAATEGVTIPVVHGPFLLITRQVLGSDPVDKAQRSVSLAGELGADTMIVHPPFLWQRDFHRWLLEEAPVLEEQTKVNVGVENLYPVKVAGRMVRFHRYTDPDHLLPFRNTVLDTSHFAVSGVDVVEAWESLRSNACHLHVSDNRGQGRDSHAPLGHGILPIAGLLNKVGADASWGGAITLELDCRRYLDDRSALVGYLAQERAKAQDLLRGASSEEVLGRPDRPKHAPDQTREGRGDGPVYADPSR